MIMHGKRTGFIGWGIAALLLSGCGDSGTSPKIASAFYNISKPDSLYLAYESPDFFNKPDTISLSFNYNPAKVTSIYVSATLDSGKSWILVSSITPNSSGFASVLWTPKTDAVSDNFTYFGEKKSFFRIQDASSNETIESDKFIVIGRETGILISPKGGEILRSNDSITVRYAQNQDLTGHLELYYSPIYSGYPDSVNWIPPQVSQQLGPSSNLIIKYFIAKFSLSDPNNNYDLTALLPIKVMVADYGKSPRTWISGAITILK
jgi:hypothetical protein